jgi:FkbM family methyltransferase
MSFKRLTGARANERCDPERGRHYSGKVVSLKGVAQDVTPMWLWSHLRVGRLRWQLRRFEAYEVERTYGAGTLRVHIADPMARAWYDRDWPEPSALALFRDRSLRPGATVFNLGAHHGVVALMLEREVRPNGRVVAVEGTPHNVAVARKNAALNNAAVMNVVHAAAAERTGTIDFSLALNGRVDDGKAEYGRVRVPAVTVDDLTATYGDPDLLFIDVEGYEQRVLEGSAATLERRPDIFMEVHETLHRYGGSVDELIALLGGYRLLVAESDSGSFRPFDGPLARRFFLAALAEARSAQPQSDRAGDCANERGRGAGSAGTPTRDVRDERGLEERRRSRGSSGGPSRMWSEWRGARSSEARGGAP